MHIQLGNGIPILYRSLSMEISIGATGGAVGSNGTPYKFPENNILQTPGVKIYALDAFIVTQQSVSPGGAAVIALAGALALTVTLQDKKSVNRVLDEPYYNFISALNTGYQRMFKPFEFVPTQSQVKVTDRTQFTAGEVALFQFYYITPEDEKQFMEEIRNLNLK